jgi:hypothetical protein
MTSLLLLYICVRFIPFHYLSVKTIKTLLSKKIFLPSGGYDMVFETMTSQSGDITRLLQRIPPAFLFETSQRDDITGR